MVNTRKGEKESDVNVLSGLTSGNPGNTGDTIKDTIRKIK
jgi:hypothetical protein